MYPTLTSLSEHKRLLREEASREVHDEWLPQFKNAVANDLPPSVREAIERGARRAYYKARLKVDFDFSISSGEWVDDCNRFLAGLWEEARDIEEGTSL